VLHQQNLPFVPHGAIVGELARAAAKADLVQNKHFFIGHCFPKNSW
jgi:hypothetical protein